MIIVEKLIEKFAEHGITALVTGSAVLKRLSLIDRTVNDVDIKLFSANRERVTLESLQEVLQSIFPLLSNDDTKVVSTQINNRYPDQRYLVNMSLYGQETGVFKSEQQYNYVIIVNKINFFVDLSDESTLPYLNETFIVIDGVPCATPTSILAAKAHYKRPSDYQDIVNVSTKLLNLFR